jgi:hypothetical protein
VSVEVRKWHRRTGSRVALGVGAPVVLLALAQAFLPMLAAQRVRDEVKPYGALQSVSVSAWPAIELLWGKADSAKVTARSLRLTEAQAAKLAWEARGVQDVQMSIARLDLVSPALPSGLLLHQASLSKRGDLLSIRSTLDQADLTAGLPAGFQVQPLASAAGALRVRASGGLFGARASLEALVTPREGKLVAVPQGLPLAGLFQVTLFGDPHLYVERMTAEPLPGAPASWSMTMSGRLR